jgi:hypothetical protein
MLALGCTVTTFRAFEQEAIRLMTKGQLPDNVLEEVLSSESQDRYEYTGSGYFLTVRDSRLPSEKRSLGDPPVAGLADEIQAGFVVHLGDNELTLECHTWGELDVPVDFRERQVRIITPPVNYVDLTAAS